MLKKIYTSVMHESLYRNSVYFMASTLITAIFGFIFWILNARLFRPEQIGIATTIVSATALITQFSLLGLKNSIIRYLPKSATKNNKINTGSNIITVFTLVLCVLYILFLPVLSTKLLFLRDNVMYSFLFIIFVLSFSLNQLQESIFVAYRSTGYVLVKNALWGIIKVILPMFLISFGAFGVFFAFSFGSIISFLFGLYVLIRRFQYKISPVVSLDVIKQIGKFSLGDYVGIFFAELPYFIMPLIIINYIGASQSAYYYIDLQIATFLYMIPFAITQSLFAEGSANEQSIKQHLKKAAILIFCLLIPAILATVVFGGLVLKVFGSLYAENGLVLLRLLAIGGVFSAINSIGSAILHIQKKIKTYVFLNFISAIVLILASFVLLSHGLSGIGMAIITEQAVITVIYTFILIKSFR